MIIENNTYTKQEFDSIKADNNLEVFTENQIKNYALNVGGLITKSHRNELTESEKENMIVGKMELQAMTPIKIVENINGHIIKSLVFVTPKQVEITDSFEKSENGESKKKVVFLDTDLNRKLNRVGKEFEKGFGDTKKDKSEVYKATYNEIIKAGSKGLFDDMKKSHPEMTEDDYNLLKKGFETKTEGSEKEVKDSGESEEDSEDDKEESDEKEEVEKHFADALNKLNDNFTKGLISEELYSTAINQFDNLIQKARPTKYFKREGAQGSYKYYYTKEDYQRSHGGQQTDVNHGKEKKESGLDSLPKQEKDLVKRAILNIERSKGKDYSPNSSDIQNEVNKLEKQGKETGEKPTENKEGEKSDDYYNERLEIVKVKPTKIYNKDKSGYITIEGNYLNVKGHGLVSMSDSSNGINRPYNPSGGLKALEEILGSGLNGYGKGVQFIKIDESQMTKKDNTEVIKKENSEAKTENKEGEKSEEVKKKIH